MDLRRERDIEQLRRIALTQQVQIEQLLRVLRAQSEELHALKGDPAELQQTLALVESLKEQHRKALESVAAADVDGHQEPRIFGEVHR